MPITILSPTTNVGNASVVYGLAANSGEGRTGFVRIGTKLFTVGQAGLTNMFRAVNLTFQPSAGATLSLADSGGTPRVLEYSDDLLYWLPLSTSSAAGTILDSSSTNAAWRFYRVRELP